MREIATLGDAAQVVPERLVNALAEASGARIVIGIPKQLKRLSEKTTMVMEVDRADGEVENMKFDKLIIACGPWSSQVAATLGMSINECYGEKCHSILLQDDAGGNSLDPTCLFLDWRGQENVTDLELYSRVDGMYGSGNCEGPTRDISQPEDVESNEKIAGSLADAAGKVAPSLSSYRTRRSTACYLPICETGKLLVGKVQSADNVFVGTGHSCWGIMNGPATGKALAEMIVMGETSSPEIWDAFAPR